MNTMYKDLGVLRDKEISSFKYSLITSKLGENKNKFFKWLGIRSYGKIDFKDINIPDSKIAAMAIEEANDTYKPSLLKHCYRTYFFSLGLAFSQNLKIDEEFLFTTSILHDIGLTDKHNHVCSKQCFAVYGGDIVKDFAMKNGVDELRAGSMQAAINMHLNPYVDKEKYGNEAYLLSKGAAMDVIGAHSFQLSLNFINDVHKKFPRTNFKEDILETMTSLSHKENTRADILFKMGFQKLASNNKLDTI
ncbi:HD domain-containing protein [Salegentibacter maritimus]|uniref:Nitrile hydratase n=1 Tax=Salegentibacter maritimus TaxID=2794347 RepID=A0ABS0TF46_9FLAO|nr:nitrile hydratase [Salegentibacter maritimus]MBI6118623.1 nitrile hydratase [Salegentibacter maritimus]